MTGSRVTGVTGVYEYWKYKISVVIQDSSY